MVEYERCIDSNLKPSSQPQHNSRSQRENETLVPALALTLAAESNKYFDEKLYWSETSEIIENSFKLKLWNILKKKAGCCIWSITKNLVFEEYKFKS